MAVELEVALTRGVTVKVDVAEGTPMVLLGVAVRLPVALLVAVAVRVLV